MKLAAPSPGSLRLFDLAGNWSRGLLRVTAWRRIDRATKPLTHLLAGLLGLGLQRRCLALLPRESSPPGPWHPSLSELVCQHVFWAPRCPENFPKSASRRFPPEFFQRLHLWFHSPWHPLLPGEHTTLLCQGQNHLEPLPRNQSNRSPCTLTRNRNPRHRGEDLTGRSKVVSPPASWSTSLAWRITTTIFFLFSRLFRCRSARWDWVPWPPLRGSGRRRPGAAGEGEGEGRGEVGRAGGGGSGRPAEGTGVQLPGARWRRGAAGRERWRPRGHRSAVPGLGCRLRPGAQPAWKRPPPQAKTAWAKMAWAKMATAFITSHIYSWLGVINQHSHHWGHQFVKLLRSSNSFALWYTHTHTYITLHYITLHFISFHYIHTYITYIHTLHTYIYHYV